MERRTQMYCHADLLCAFETAIGTIGRDMPMQVFRSLNGVASRVSDPSMYGAASHKDSRATSEWKMQAIQGLGPCRCDAQ